MRWPVYLLIVVSVAACKPAVRDENYFPMKKGDEHTYEDTYIKPGELPRRKTLHMIVLETIKQNGNDYWRIRNDFIGERDQAGTRSYVAVKLLYRVDKSGVFGIREQQPAEAELQIIKFPLKPGASWEVLMGKQNTKFTIMGFENVNVENIIYKRCVHLHGEANDGYVIDNWKAPGVGDIKSASTDSVGMKEISVLKEFKPGK